MRGFSFPEILFAVAVLGIGFIMIAGIFPVAILQTQAAMEETTGTTVARNAVNLVGSTPGMRKDFTTAGVTPLTVQYVPPTPNPQPPTGSGVPSPVVYSFRDPRVPTAAAGARAELWNSIRGNLIDATDPRFATIPMYVREPGSNFIRVICVAVRMRNAEKFERDRDAAVLSPTATTIPRIELQPVPAAVTLVNSDVGPDLITIDELTTTETGVNDLVTLSKGVRNAARDGAFVIISDDRGDDDNTTTYKNEVGQSNGRIYRLGPQVGANQWELAAGYDMQSDNENLPKAGSKKAIAFVVGAGLADPATPANGYSGANRSVQVFDSLISLKD